MALAQLESVLHILIPVAHLEQAGGTAQCIVGVGWRTEHGHLADQLSLVN